MKHLTLLFAFGALLGVSQASAGTDSALQPNCPFDSRSEDVPELMLTFDSFDEASFANDMAALKQKLPEWIERRNKSLLENTGSKKDPMIFDGELSMAYTNTLMGIEGYILKLEYLSADETTRPQKEKAFCDFIRENIIID